MSKVKNETSVDLVPKTRLSHEIDLDMKTRLYNEIYLQQKPMSSIDPKKYWIDDPEYLTQLSESGLPNDVLRGMFQQEAIPFSNKVNEQKRQLDASYSRMGIESGFQQQSYTQLAMQKKSALTMLLTSVNEKNADMQQNAMQRLKNLHEFNKQIQDTYEQFGESKAFEIGEIVRNYNNQTRQQSAAKDAAKGRMLGKVLSLPLNFLPSFPNRRREE